MGLDKWILTSVYCYSITESFHCLVQSVNRVQLFVTPWTAACQASLSITSSQSLLKLMSIESLMPSNHLIFCHPLSSRLQSFPASGSFQMSQLFVSDDQSIGVSASASILPVNIQDWSPLGWTGWISLQSKGLSRVFSNTTVQKHQFFGGHFTVHCLSNLLLYPFIPSSPPSPFPGSHWSFYHFHRCFCLFQNIVGISCIM